jgi:hypothetical protein
MTHDPPSSLDTSAHVPGWLELAEFLPATLTIQVSSCWSKGRDSGVI